MRAVHDSVRQFLQHIRLRWGWWLRACVVDNSTLDIVVNREPDMPGWPGVGGTE